MQRGNWRTGLRGGLAAGVLWTLAAGGARAADAPDIRLGFGGHAKEGRSFPVTVGPLPGAARCTLRAMVGNRWSGGPPACLAMFEAVPAAPDGGWQALARVPEQMSGDPFLRCELTLDDGAVRTFDTRLDLLDEDDLLLLAFTGRPEDFEFLAGVAPERREVVRCVAATNFAALPPAWTGLDTVDLVVLDGGPSPTPAQAACLRDWVAQGGTLLLTHRALAAPAGVAGDLLPAPPAAAARREAAGADVACLLGSRTNLLATLQYVDAARPGFVTLMPGPAGALVAGRNLGAGRLLALGVDWQSLVLRDPALYETARRMLWARVLDLRATAERRTLDRDIAVPREAQVRFLLGPLVGFAALCLLLLGPVNALVLRRLRRLEHAAVTLPAGAAALAALAFAGGLALRTRDVVVVDREATVTRADGTGRAYGLSGVLAPGARTFALGVADPRALLMERRPGYDPFGEVDPALRWTASPGGPRVAGVGIPRWSMRFFSTWRPCDGGAPAATAEVVSTNLLRGRVVNRAAHALQDACVAFRWDRVTLGDLAPGEGRDFALALTPYGAQAGELCPCCHSLHGPRSAFGPMPGQPDLPGALRDLVGACPYGAVDPDEAPVLLAWHTNAPPLLDVAGAAPRRDASRLVVAEVALSWPRPVAVPEGLVRRLEVPGPDPESEETDGGLLPDLERRPLDEVPDLLAACDLQRTLPALRVPRPAGRRQAMGVDATDVALRNRRWFRLPAAAAPPPAGATLAVQWDMGLQDPDDEKPRHAAILSILNWQTGSWDELGRAATNAHAFRASAAAHVRPWPPLVVLQLTSTAPPDAEKPWNGLVYPAYLGLSLATEGEQP